MEEEEDEVEEVEEVDSSGIGSGDNKELSTMRFHTG